MRERRRRRGQAPMPAQPDRAPDHPQLRRRLEIHQHQARSPGR
jgi:hypothetical protein